MDKLLTSFFFFSWRENLVYKTRAFKTVIAFLLEFLLKWCLFEYEDLIKYGIMAICSQDERILAN